MFFGNAVDSVSVIFVDSEGDLSEVTIFFDYATLCADRALCAIEVPNFLGIVDRLLSAKSPEEIEKTVLKLTTIALWFTLKQF